MRKSLRQIFILSICFLATTVSWAQVSLGVRGGANFATFAVEGDDQEFPFKPKTGLNFAILFNLPLGASTSIQIEPGFSQRGARISAKTNEFFNNQQIKAEIDGKLLVNYIEMPVLFQYRPKLGKLEGLLSIGPEVRLMTGNIKAKSSSKVYIDGVLVSDTSEDESYGSGDDTQKFDFGMVGGAGLAYPLGIVKVFVEGRYHFGLRNLATTDDGDDSKVHNRGASAHIGILVPIGK
ncbi:PorT family protein [Dyadobacter sp. CY345]|uniref:porin family protein n=1 Tax=Dyadobacter sp. CY345 TaxID=2909335 RepID=UPI001F3B8275|nr:porin family protein [Dyadobacter sp. CY345]MCF2445727.1 PorT family protein [Dyadobacter sp. CY345]